MALIDDIKQKITANGPMPVADYMQVCLAHYYAQGAAIGADGDFTTAPEISQMFGEIIGAWMVHVATMLGPHTPINLVELGPGRGTLCADILRLARLRPEIHAAIKLHLVETSPALRTMQRQKLKQTIDKAAIEWHDTIETLPKNAPLIVIANEFFDALPVRQLVRDTGQWRARAIDVQNDGLRFTTIPLPDPPHHLPTTGHDGDIIEHHHIGAMIMTDLATRIHRQGGAVLIIDYGYEGPATGDTLQALKRHAFTDPLAEPGSADLTTHVDFNQLGQAATGCRVAAPITQAAFLSALGIAERARQLVRQNPAKATGIETDLARLMSPEAMGALFKVMALWHPDLPPPPPFG